MDTLQKADLGTTEITFNLTKWKGAEVELYATGRVFFVWSTQPSGAVINDTEALSADSPNSGAPGILEPTSRVPRVDQVPGDEPFLHVKAETTARFAVRRRRPGSRDV